MVVAVVFRCFGRVCIDVDRERLHRAPEGRGEGPMKRAYVFRLRPTARQNIALAACVDAHRELYNAALRERRDAWAHSRTRIGYRDQSAQLTEIRAARPDQALWSFSSQQATLRRLNRAFASFFRRVKTAKPGIKPGYPRFIGCGAVRLGGVAQRRRRRPLAARAAAGISTRHRPGQSPPAPLGGRPGENNPDQTPGTALDAGAVLR